MKITETLPGEAARARSQTSLVYARLRAGILAGRHAPGERLKIADVAAAMDVSPGAVREALSRLVPEQLVVTQDQKGFQVAPLSIEDLEDLTDLRCDVESLALRRSVEQGDDVWEAAILAAAHRLSRTPPRAGDGAAAASDWIARHAEFHAALVSGCGSRRLLALHHQLYEQSERYRILSARVDGDRDVGAEHQAIVDAALARDADQLVTLVEAHIRHTTRLIVAAARAAAAA